MQPSIVNPWNERLKNAIIFFITHDRRTVKLTKLMKLLYFLDFKHYRESGRSVTGQEYLAWPKGPVPADVWHEIRRGEPRGCDLLSYVQPIEVPEKIDDFGFDLRLRQTAFDDYYFTPREKKILGNLSEIFKNIPAHMMVEATHVPGQPWDKVIKTAGQGAPIPYKLALGGLPQDVIEEFEEERSDHEALDKFFAELS